MRRKSKQTTRNPMMMTRGISDENYSPQEVHKQVIVEVEEENSSDNNSSL